MLRKLKKDVLVHLHIIKQPCPVRSLLGCVQAQKGCHGPALHVCWQEQKMILHVHQHSM